MNRAIIFTAKKEETDAVKMQLLGPIRAGKTQRGNRYTIWHLRSSQDREHAVPDLEVGLYETGRGQAQTIIHTTHLVESFRPDVAIFIGCAGGDPDETEIGDVVVATEIWNYEAASVGANDDGRIKGHPSSPDRVLIDDSKVVDEFGRWRHRLPGGARNDIEVHFAPVASGEKVVKSRQATIWRRIKDSLSDEIIACETEGHGFLAAIDPLKTYGIMIRGISDTLDNKGKSGKAADDDNQRTATAHAAAFAGQVLEEIDYRLLRSVKEPNSPEQMTLTELVSIEFQTDLSRLPEAMRALKKVVGADRVSVRRVDEGSIIVVVEMEPKSAALTGALFDGGLLARLVGYQVRQCVSSIRFTGDAEFDDWLASVRRGRVAGGEAILRSSKNRRWLDLAKDLTESLKRKEGVARPRRDRYVALSGLSEVIYRAGVTKRAVAMMAGFSGTTISRAFNGFPVNGTTARRIHLALQEVTRGDAPPFEAVFRPID